VCPYHGWAFDAEGKLRDVPSAEHGSWPKRPLLGSYDVEERGGFVWLFYGNRAMPADERPPIPATPELEDPQWRAGEGWGGGVLFSAAVRCILVAGSVVHDSVQQTFRGSCKYQIWR
jgi:phenylpropionate dioxygenase-like ring-hydroxylating dioxygenase large terminal subunit